MDVQRLIEMQQRGITQLQEATGYAQRRIEWESRMFQRHQWLWDMERRAAMLCGPSEIVRATEAIRPRPFDDLISRMERDVRAVQTVSDHLNDSAMARATLEATMMGETIRKMIEPIPSLKTVLPDPAFFATVFDSARALPALVDLQTRIAILTTNSLAQSVAMDSIVASTIGNTIKAISAVVDVAHRPYVGNPLFGTESVASDYADLSEVVDYGSENFSRPDFGPLIQAILVEIQGLRMDSAKEKLARTILLWATILTLLMQAADYYNRHVSESRRLPPVQQGPSAPPTEKPDTNDAGPCP